METRNFNKPIIQTLMPEIDWEILQENCIYKPSEECFRFVGDREEVVKLLSQISFIDEYKYIDEIIGNNILLEIYLIISNHYYYSTSDRSFSDTYKLDYYIETISVSSEKKDRFVYSKEALKLIELPISLEYKIRGAPTLDWTEAVIKELIQ